jgi:hypothetical protein
MNPVKYTIETPRRLLADEGFKSRHRARDQVFTRVRCLPLAVVIGADPEKKREVLAKRRQRSDGLAEGRAGHARPAPFPKPATNSSTPRS